MTATRNEALSRLWLEYVAGRYDEWAAYHGECDCRPCRDFRTAFKAWLADRCVAAEARAAEAERLLEIVYHDPWTAEAAR